MRKYLQQITLLLIISIVVIGTEQTVAQNYHEVIPKTESYGIDYKNNLIVWNVDLTDFASLSSNKDVQVQFNEGQKFIFSLKELSYQERLQTKNAETQFRIYITQLPIIKITIDTIKDDPKTISKFSFADRDTIINASPGIEYRGNISLKFPKKTYDLEFWEDDQEESVDLQFGDMRNDDDWVLDGLYNEPLRLRSFLANTLWLSIHQSHYLDQEKDAKSGVDLLFTEVFLNENYIGIYALMEQVDRKLLQLKKYNKKKIKGELFKASSYNGAPSYKAAPKYKNIFPHWAGYEIEYPYKNYKAQWKNIYKFTRFVVKSKDSVFKKKVSKKFNLDNAIDYFLFVNLLRATDNLGKNFYVARYDKKTPYFNIPWDLDGVLGTIQDGKRISTTDDILSNGLFDRLMKTNPDNFRRRLKERWSNLRRQQLSNDNLFEMIQEQYDYFFDNKVYEREQMVWLSGISLQDHFDYMTTWLLNRLQYLDKYFDTL
ncbi:CotH kinase family protein [Aquimarina spongiae]|nr:CotH kinase family protein [Aquimarina spongiae]